jgi:hypothetical protein
MGSPFSSPINKSIMVVKEEIKDLRERLDALRRFL